VDDAELYNSDLCKYRMKSFVVLDFRYLIVFLDNSIKKIVNRFIMIGKFLSIYSWGTFGCYGSLNLYEESIFLFCPFFNVNMPILTGLPVLYANLNENGHIYGKINKFLVQTDELPSPAD